MFAPDFNASLAALRFFKSRDQENYDVLVVHLTEKTNINPLLGLEQVLGGFQASRRFPQWATEILTTQNKRGSHASGPSI
jgi:hypothetical protein